MQPQIINHPYFTLLPIITAVIAAMLMPGYTKESFGLNRRSHQNTAVPGHADEIIDHPVHPPNELPSGTDVCCDQET